VNQPGGIKGTTHTIHPIHTHQEGFIQNRIDPKYIQRDNKNSEGAYGRHGRAE